MIFIFKKTNNYKNIIKEILNIPAIFKGLTFYIDHSVNKGTSDLITRYILGHGGTLIHDKTKKDSITHYCTDDIGSVDPDVLNIIKPEWIIKCHNKNRVIS